MFGRVGATVVHEATTPRFVKPIVIGDAEFAEHAAHARRGACRELPVQCQERSL